MAASAANSFRCDMCGAAFSNKYALGPHKKWCWNRIRLADGWSSEDFTGDSGGDDVAAAQPTRSSQSTSDDSGGDDVAAQPARSSPLPSYDSGGDDEAAAQPARNSPPPSNDSGGDGEAAAQPTRSLRQLAHRHPTWGLRVASASDDRLRPGFNRAFTVAYEPVIWVQVRVRIFVQI